ncbi:hypothetical protein TTHERM_00420940 (macronuclear) [Tetrahymena thermophila SB210]|uniref:Uncharacterized protein n=1 Tax=Tetrahymena thermophila (strain SB210) TaxID=312017 RepID=I7LTQ9_TETTS|nr:hypothetical protein TTHERM_00420940 [Tetrahymena thermophila SB210]EAR85686.2 hypothetical protein TTHERM_00420940 [Tetrahymena thermophila SB210]|eukprot:XP_001033349.2 hypothetical protein TTHERM_00420940 [Tetrahymena thermophila SB210]
MITNINKSINKSNSNQQFRNFNNIDWNIIEKIIKSSNEKFQKEKEFNAEGELNLMRILASYSNILEQNDINPNQDTDYYNFFLTVSKYMQKNGILNWMEASAAVLQNSKSNNNTSQSFEQKSNLCDSKNFLLGQQMNQKSRTNSKQYLTSNSGFDRMSQDEFYNQNQSNSVLNFNQTRLSEDLQMENNPHIQNRISQSLQTQQGFISTNSNFNETLSREDKKKQRKNAKNNLIQTINSNLELIENKLVDIEESQNNITRLNISDLDLSNISHANINNNTLVSNLNAHLNSIKYVNQTKNELKSQLGFDNSFLEQALNQTTQDQTNTSHWQQNTQYISIKEQEQEEDEDEENGNEQYNENTQQHKSQEIEINYKNYDENNLKYNQQNEKKSNNFAHSVKTNYGIKNNNHSNTSYDNDLYQNVPQQDTSISYEKLFSNQTLLTGQGNPSPISHNNSIQNLTQYQGDSYFNKSATNQFSRIEQLGNNSFTNSSFKQKYYQKTLGNNISNSTNNNLYSSKINLSSHLEKFNKLNNSNNNSMNNLKSKLNDQSKYLQPQTTDFTEYAKQSKDQFQNSTLKGMSSLLSFNPQKSQLLASFEKQFQQLNRRQSHESELNHTLGKSELNQFNTSQPILLQSKQKHNVSFGENSIFSLDENEQNFKLKSQSFIRWVQFVNNRRQIKWEKEEQIRKIILALDYYQSMTKQKVFILLKGYNMLMKERRKKEQVIQLKCQRNLKQKYFQLYLLNYQLSLIDTKQNQKAIKFANRKIKMRYLVLLQKYKNKQKEKRQQNPKKQVFNKIFIEFVLMLALEKINMDIQDKKEFWLRIKSFQEEKACSILQKYIKSSNITEQNIQTQLKPHLEWLKVDAKQKIFKSFIEYKKFMEDSQQFRSCRIKFYIFQTWKNKLIKKKEQENLLQQHFNLKYTKILEKIITSWRDIATRNSLLKQRYKYLKIQSKFNMLEKYFSRWYDKFEYYVQNKEEIIKGQQIKGYLTIKRVFQAMINFQQQQIQKKEYYQYAFTHYSINLCKKTFRGYEIIKQKKENYNRVVNQVEDYLNSKILKNFFKNWKKQIIQEKMVNNFIRQMLYTKVIKGLQIYSNIMKNINNKINILVEKSNQRYLVQGLNGFIQNYIQQQKNIQLAFSHNYMKNLAYSFKQLQKNVLRKKRKYVYLVEYTKNKSKQFILKCFEGWKLRSQIKQRKRMANKIAVNNFIHNLFKKMIKIFRQNVEKNQIKQKIYEMMDQQNQKKFFNYWKEAHASNLSNKFYQKKILSKIFSLWKQQIEEKIIKLTKRKQAALLYTSKLMQIASLFIECLKINKEKALYKKQAMERVSQIYKQKQKKKTFLLFKNQIQKIQKHQQNFKEIQKKCTISILKNHFQNWRQTQDKSNKKFECLRKMEKINRMSKIKQSFEVWQQFVNLMKYDEALYQKSQSFRDYLLIKRFYKIVKQRSIARQNEIEKLKAADYYYKRCSFYKLVNTFYNSIQEKKQKRISLKHYAIKILSTSFYNWKRYTQEKYERQFYKIMSSSKRDNMLDNSISNYVSEEQSPETIIQDNQLAASNLNINSIGYDTLSKIQQQNFNSTISNNNSSILINKDASNLTNNLSNLFKNSVNKKSVKFQQNFQDDLLTSNLNYTGVQNDLQQYQLEAEENQSN